MMGWDHREIRSKGGNRCPDQGGKATKLLPSLAKHSGVDCIVVARKGEGGSKYRRGGEGGEGSWGKGKGGGGGREGWMARKLGEGRVVLILGGCNNWKGVTSSRRLEFGSGSLCVTTPQPFLAAGGEGASPAHISSSSSSLSLSFTSLSYHGSIFQRPRYSLLLLLLLGRTGVYLVPSSSTLPNSTVL